MFKTHHKMIGWNHEFQYLLAKIICEIVKYQYLPAKTILFSLSHLTLSSLSHIPLSPLFSWLWFHSQWLSATLEPPLFEFILMHLARGLSSKLIIPPCVRACVRACVPLLGEAQNLCFCTILSEISENHICILQYLAPGRSFCKLLCKLPCHLLSSWAAAALPDAAEPLSHREAKSL